MIVAGVSVAYGKIELANIEPLAIELGFLQPVKGDLCHPSAVAVGISTRTENEIVRHTSSLAEIDDTQTNRNHSHHNAATYPTPRGHECSCGSSALKPQGIVNGLLPGKNVACRMFDDRSIVSLVVEIMRFNWISLQVIEFIQVLISQAELPTFR